jgi:hypothetical protein
VNDEDEEEESDGEVVFKSKLDSTCIIFSEILESFVLIILFGGCFVGGR